LIVSSRSGTGKPSPAPSGSDQQGPLPVPSHRQCAMPEPRRHVVTSTRSSPRRYAVETTSRDSGLAASLPVDEELRATFVSARR
jgi:hypothetical protein